VAAYRVFVCALFTVQGGMWTGYSQSTYLSAMPVVNTNNTLYYRPLSSCFDTSIVQTASSEFVSSNIQESI